MKRFAGLVLKDVVGPLSMRLGSLSAGALVALGATQPLADQVETLVPALICFASELLLRAFLKRARSF